MKKILSMVLMLSLVGTLTVGLAGCTKKEPVETPPVSSAEPTVPVEPTDDVEDVILADVSVSNIVDTLKATYGENYLPNMELDAATFETLTGLTSDKYSEFYGAMPMISTHVDSVLIAKTDDTVAVETAFLAYREKLLTDTVQYPMNQPKIAASTVVTFDDYVVFLMLGGYTSNNDATAEEIADFCNSQTTLGVEALEKLFTEGYVPVENIESVEPTPDTTGSVEVILPENTNNTSDVVVGEPTDSPIDDNMLIDTVESEKPVVNDNTRVNSASDFE